MACSVYGPEPAFARIRKLRIYQSLASLIPRRPANSESHQRVTARLATRLLKVNLRQAFNRLEARGEQARPCGRQSGQLPIPKAAGEAAKKHFERRTKNTIGSFL